MPKTTIDQLLATVEAVQLLEQTVTRHAQVIERMVDWLEEMQRQLNRLETEARQ